LLSRPVVTKDFSRCKVAELRELLADAGFPTSGKKAELVARLLEHSQRGAVAVEQEVAEEQDKEEEDEEEASKTKVTKNKTKAKAKAQDEEDKEEQEVEAETSAVEAAERKEPKNAAPIRKAATKIGGPMFEVGELIEALSKDDNQWYAAKVLKDLGDRSFKVSWVEDDTEQDLTPGYVRKKISEVDRDGPFLPGEAVEALYEEEGKMYTGIIQKINEDGTFLLLWDEDGEEYTCKPEVMMKIAPKIELSELEVGQKTKGMVRSVRDFGAFVDVGAVRDGLLHVSRMKQVDRPKGAPAFDEGDRVEALYEEEHEWYSATVDKVNEDGTFNLTWDDGDESATLKANQIRLQGPRMPVKVGDTLELWISQITTDGKFSVSMLEGGGTRPQPHQEFSAFVDIRPDEFIDAMIQKVTDFGFFVEAREPSGATAPGFVHLTRIRDGYVASPFDEGEVGQDVKVRVEFVDTKVGKMTLSMKECA